MCLVMSRNFPAAAACESRDEKNGGVCVGVCVVSHYVRVGMRSAEEVLVCGSDPSGPQIIQSDIPSLIGTESIKGETVWLLVLLQQ